MWEKSLREMLNMKKKLWKRCTAWGKIMRDLLNVEKICKRCAEFEKIK